MVRGDSVWMYFEIYYELKYGILFNLQYKLYRIKDSYDKSYLNTSEIYLYLNTFNNLYMYLILNEF